MKKVFYFFLLFLYVLGSIGGIGYAAYNKAWLIAAGVVAVSAMAFPVVKDMFNFIKG